MSNFKVITWSASNITKFSFHTNSKDEHSTMKNNGVMVEFESMYYSSSKVINYVLASREYFEVIKEILEIGYVIFKQHLFKCK